MSEKVKEVAKEEFEQAKELAADAVRSGAYLYPLKGIAYFFTHRELWRPLANKLVPTISLGVGVLTFMFAVTYIPQAAVLTLVNGPLAILTTSLLVLSEASTIFNVLSKNFLIDDALLDTFDGTLLSRGNRNLVATERSFKNGTDYMARLGKITRKPFQKWSPKAIIRYFLYLPLNMIPVVGTVLFVILQGRKFGPTAHARYFQLKKMSKSQRDEFVERRKAAYTSFGVPAVILELIPVAGIFFSFTNTVGAALWAADIEAKSAPGESTAPQLHEQAAMAGSKKSS